MRLTDAMDGATTVVHLASNPDIAKAMTDPTIDFDQGTLPHALRRRGGTASRRSDSCSTHRAVACTAISARLEARRAPRSARTGVDVRREQARGRGADRVVLPHVRHARTRLPVRQRRRARTRPTASASTSSASCSPTRRDSRSSATDRRASRTSTSTTCSRPCCSQVRRASSRSRSSTSRPATTSRSREIAALAIECLGLDPDSVELVFSGGDRGWKGDVPVVRIATERIRRLGWSNRYDTRRRCELRSLSMLDDARAGRLVDESLDEDGAPCSSIETVCSTSRRCAAGCRIHPTSADVVERLPGVEDACRRLADAGWVLVVVTNQPDVARGTCTLEAVDAINSKITAGLPITETVVCPHDDADDCACRKPRPGMLLAAASRWEIDLGGERHDRRPVARHRGRAAAGTRTVFVEHGDAEPDPVSSRPCRRQPDGCGRTDPARGSHRMTQAAKGSAANVRRPTTGSRIGANTPTLRRTTPRRSTAGGSSSSSSSRPAEPHRVLDIGSGQGDLLAAMRPHWPTAELAGIELSAEGVRRSQVKVPDARFVQLDLMTEANDRAGAARLG